MKFERIACSISRTSTTTGGCGISHTSQVQVKAIDGIVYELPIRGTRAGRGQRGWPMIRSASCPLERRGGGTPYCFVTAHISISACAYHYSCQLSENRQRRGIAGERN